MEYRIEGDGVSFWTSTKMHPPSCPGSENKSPSRLFLKDTHSLHEVILSEKEFSIFVQQKA